MSVLLCADALPSYLNYFSPLNGDGITVLIKTLGLPDLRAKYQARTLRLGLLMQAVNLG
jgi:hypothetical protein